METQNMMNELLEQTQFDEDRGLLPKGYTLMMRTKLGVIKQ